MFLLPLPLHLHLSTIFAFLLQLHLLAVRHQFLSNALPPSVIIRRSPTSPSRSIPSSHPSHWHPLLNLTELEIEAHPDSPPALRLSRLSIPWCETSSAALPVVRTRPGVFQHYLVGTVTRLRRGCAINTSIARPNPSTEFQ